MDNREDTINKKIRKRIRQFVNQHRTYLDPSRTYVGFDQYFRVTKYGNIYEICANPEERYFKYVRREEIVYEYLKYLTLHVYKRLVDQENSKMKHSAKDAKWRILREFTAGKGLPFDPETIAKYGEALGPKDIRQIIDYNIPKKYCNKTKEEFPLKTIFFESAKKIISFHKQKEPGDITSVYEAIDAIYEQVESKESLPNLDEIEENIRDEGLQPFVKVWKFLGLNCFRHILNRMFDFTNYNGRHKIEPGSEAMLRNLKTELNRNEQAENIFKELRYQSHESFLCDWLDMRDTYAIDDDLTNLLDVLKYLSNLSKDITLFVEDNPNKKKYIDEEKMSNSVIYYNETFTMMRMFQKKGRKKLLSISKVPYDKVKVAEAIATTTDKAVSRICEFYKKIRKAADEFTIIDRSEYEKINEATMRELRNVYGNPNDLKKYLSRFFQIYLTQFGYLRMQSADKVVHHIIKHPAVNLYAPIPDEAVAREDVELYFKTVAMWVANTSEANISWTLDKTGCALIHFEGQVIPMAPKNYRVIVRCKPKSESNCEITLLTGHKVKDNSPFYSS